MAKNSNIKELSDIELISKYKNSRDKIYIGELYERYTRMVFFICMKYHRDEEKSKDAVMQIFEKLFNDLLKHEIESFKSWLHTVAKNHCLIQLRSDKSELNRHNKFKTDQKSFVESGDELYHDNVEQNTTYEDKIDDALNSLNKEQKICVELFYLQEKCYNEIAEITGYDLKKVKSYIQNGKRNLKIYLLKFEKNKKRKIMINGFLL